ncbi:hypothetical protein SODALDRAFT_351526 [Sodiomyces alkalinus F11]|uniref:Uncharacterized protein n=1 Tax=Sodiomyces alkalinus (strain CBS 110278 / VKM F-3762 / F11) TaxID=1314773 RepID=A0A3N2PRP3_SODAK|nr:hypothetical protein SODALDRAFT_351526 [Sodiomyces alkalinus F11]ROT37191.1 hypothetical protein SODALDRAFT_351526 [Sodiomyces alkalinus F11]
MGFFDFDGGSVLSTRSSHSHRKSKSSKPKRHRGERGRSPRSRSTSVGRRSVFAGGSVFGGEEYEKGNASRSSFFGIPNASRSSFFGFSRPSYYKRSPRQGYLHKAKKIVRRLWRDLGRYAKEHPIKVIMLVLMPLITGGFLTTLLAKFGLRLPKTVERLIGVGARAASGDSLGFMSEAVRFAGDSFGGKSNAAAGARSVSVERGRDGGLQWERRREEKDFDWGNTFSEVARYFR